MTERRMESDEPDGGVIMLALALWAGVAFVTGVAVGYGAAVLR